MQLNVVTKETNKFLNGIATSFFNSVKYTTFSAAINSVANTIQKSYSYIKDLDTGLNDIQIVTGKSADEMARFAEEANNAAKQLAVSTEKYVEGSLIYYQQGLDDTTVKTLTDISAKTSNVTGQSMSSVSEELTAVWNGYQVANEAAKEGMDVYEEYVDKLAAVGAVTASDLEELATAASKVASAASSMGVSFDDLIAQIATIVSVTRQAPESVGTALKTVYARLGDLKVDGVDEFGTKLGEVSSQLQTMGINILDTNGDMRDMTSVMTEVADKWNTWTSAQKQAAAIAMAGKRQYNNLVALFDNWDMYGEALETSMGAAGTLEKQQEIALESLANKLDILKATAEDLYDSLVSEDTLKNGVEALTEITKLLTDFSDSIGGLNNLLPLLGSTAIRVFNNQIAEGLSTIVINARNANANIDTLEQNQKELQAMFSDSAFVTQDIGTNTRLQEMAKFYEDIIQYQDVMNNSQKEHYQNILNLKNEAGKLALEVEGQANNWEVAYKWLEAANGTSGIDALYSKSKKLQSITQQIEKNLYTGLDPDNIDAIFGNNPKNFGITKKDAQGVINILQKEYDKVQDVDKALENVNNRFREGAKELSNIVAKESRVKTLDESFKNLGGTLKEDLSIKQHIADITNLIGTIGQVSMGLVTLTNLVEVWNSQDIDITDKLLQTMMNLSFVLPNLISAYKTILPTLSTYLGTNELLNQQEKLKLAQDKLSELSEIRKNQLATQRFVTLKTQLAFQKAENAVTKESTSLKTLNNLAGVNGIKIQAKETVQTLLHINALKSENAQEAIRLALKNAFIVTAAAVVVSIIALVKWQQKQLEKQIELNKAEIDRVNQLQEEVNANKELCNSYEQLYKQYVNGEDVKDELYNKTLEIAEAYDIENAKVLALTDRYDELRDAIKAARAEELGNIVSETGIETDRASKNVVNIARQGKGHKISSQYYAKFSEAENNKYFEQYLDSSVYDAMHGEVKVGATGKEIVDLYDKLSKIRQVMADAGESNTKTYQQITDWLGRMTESVDEYKESIDELSTYKVEEAFLGHAEITESTTAEELVHIIDQVKEDLGDSVDDVDKYIKNYLSGIEGVSDAVNKWELAQKISDQTGEGIEESLKLIKDFNTEQLAYLDLHLNTALLSDDLQKWMEQNQDYINFAGAQGSRSIFAGALSSFNTETGVSKESAKSFYEGSSAQFMGVSQESFNLMDSSQQLNELTKAYIENTKYVVENRDTILESLESQKESYRATGESTYKINEDTINSLNKLIEESDDYKDKSSELREALKQQAINSEQLTDEQKVLIDNFKEETNSTDETIAAYGKAIRENEEYSGTLKNFEDQIKEVKNASLDYAESQEYISTAIKNSNASLDDIQSNYKSLISMIDDYNETGSWTIDNVQQLMTMSDKYVAQLQFEGNQLSLNEEGIEAVTLAKLDELAAEADLQYQLEMTTIANAAEQNANDAAAQKEALHAQQLAALGDIAEETAAQILDLADAMSKIDKFGSEETKAAAEQVTKAWENRKKAIASARSEVGKGGASMKRAMGAGSSKSSSQKNKDAKEFDDEFDRYWEIKKAIDAIDKSVQKLDKDQQNLHGYELINSLKEENKLLSEQTKNYESLAAAQRQEAGELQGILKSFGVSFDTVGAVTNYAAATSAELAKYNDAIAQYNAGLLNDTSFEVYEKNYEKFKETLERYNTLYYDELKDTEDKLDELNRKVLANSLKSWEVEIDLKLNFKELRRGWNDFLKEIETDFKKVFKDLSVEVDNYLSNVQTYIGADGTISIDTSAIRQVEDEIDKLYAGGTSSMFESISQAQEKLKELNSQLQEDASALRDLYQQAWEAYLDGIDQTNTKFENVNNNLEKINDDLEFQSQLIELIYGDEAYDLMSKLYGAETQNSITRVSALRQQADLWEKLWRESGATIENQSEWSEDQQKYYENWQEAQSNLNNLVVEHIGLLQKDYLNTINIILKTLEGGITGFKLEDIKSQWDKIAADADKYYDSVEGAYKIQAFANKIDDTIAGTTNIKNQQKLQKFREKEIEYLREKENLTQYDLDAAEARYQIALKEMALEDAMNNKTSMKLTRNEQGNWSYQYVADTDEVANKRQELLDAYNNLYQLASDAYEANLEALQDLQEAYLESVRKIAEDTTLTEEEKNAKLAELDTWYYDQYNKLAQENTLYRNDLELAASALLLEIYRQDQDAYQSMTEKERELLDILINSSIDSFMDLEEKIKDNYNEIGSKAQETMEATRSDWTSGAQTIADLWNKDDGASVKAQVVNAYNEIISANDKYQEKIAELSNTANIAFDNIEDAINSDIHATENLKYATADLVNNAIPYLDSMKVRINEMQSAWEGVKSSIQAAISSLQYYLSLVGAAQSAAATPIYSTGSYSGASASGGTGNGGKGSGSPGTTSNTPSDNNGTYNVWNRPEHKKLGTVTASGSFEALSQALDKWPNMVQDGADWWTPGNIYLRYRYSGGGGTQYMATYDSGGYTGDWGTSDGKLAVLHQKEMVLNANDTENFLQGMNVIRSMSDLNGSIEGAILKSIAKMAVNINGINPSLVQNSSNSASNNATYNITAEFPNANDVNEIREAILSLPNLASQYTSQNKL